MQETPRIPDGLSIIAFGDVHGCLNELQDLLDRVEAHAAVRPERRYIVISLGDLIDRGTDSAGVIERLVEGVPGCETIMLRGNHEQMMLDFIDASSNEQQWGRIGCFETMASYGIDARRVLSERLPLAQVRQALPDLRRAFLAKLPAYHLNFLRNTPLHVTFGDYFFVHAGVRSYVALDRQDPQDLLWIRGEFLDFPGDFGKKIVHGHSPCDEIEFRPNRINLDTGVCLGGPLSAVLFEGAQATIF
ncbi:serine/threonine protein phosphatase [Labrys sp. KNU-23]|uniref:metallophosphoesterase family protein n=1 Tax=Labrys sp. KNU-23 TaxID=2789216 RepID=UPI0011EF2FC5|nr:metallophosphoesterase family protein [Labrys sp. KNU-23]QEN88076.1 serine/threonine protein phosphatase [Labrys sp. KNU-23]